MRKLLILLFVPIVLFWSCEDGSTELRTCEYTSEFADEYLPMAKMLNAFESNTIDLDPEITSRFLEQLYAISNHEDSDNFFQIIDDSLVKISLNSFSMSLYVDSLETQELVETGFSSNAEFDSLIDLYGITFNEITPAGTNSIGFDIALDNDVNIRALTNRFKEFPFVSSSYTYSSPQFVIPDFTFGIGYFIRVVESSNLLTKIELYIYDSFCFTPPPPPTIIHSYGIDENCVVTKIN
jgi:hypothetical protein